MRICLGYRCILQYSLFIALFATTLASASSQDFPAEIPTELEVEGDVRSIEVSRRRNARDEPVPVATAEFNRYGRIVAQDSYSEGEFQWSSRFEYDESRRLVGWISEDENESIQWEYSYVYSDHGFLEREVSYDSSGEIDSMHTYEYDSGRLLEEAVYGGSGSLQWSRQFYYDDDLTEREWRLIYPDGGVVKVSRQYLDRFGRIVREVHHDGTEQDTEVIRHDYDRVGRRVRTRVESPEEELVRSTERSFNEYGNLAQVIRTEENTDTRTERTLKYRYDDQGNWVERLETERTLRAGVESRREQELLERSIVYFD